MSDVIYNETGIGDLKGKTPNYNFNIPYFDIATWHDYIEENFRSIDALFHYIYEIKQYKGKWENNTTYKVNDVLFIVDDNSEFNGRLVKVLIKHTTDDTIHFSDYYNAHQSYYKIFADASATQIYAEEAKEARDAAKVYYDGTYQLRQDVLYSRNLTESYKTDANNSANNAKLYMNNTEEYMNNAKEYKNLAQTAKEEAQKASILAQFSPIILNNVIITTQSWKSTSNDIDINADFKDVYKYKSIYNEEITINNKLHYDRFSTTGLVMFEANDAITGNYSQVAFISVSSSKYFNIINMSVRIYAKEIPTKDITIQRVICYIKGEVYE